VRATTCAGTMPSGNGRASGCDADSANGTSRDEQKKIEGNPAEEEQSYGNAGDDECADRPAAKRLRRFLRSDWSCDVLAQVRRR
jgi:hypothetical protein